VGKDGPRLTLGNENGWPRAALGMTKDGPLLLLDKKGERRAWLTVGKDGPGLALYDENCKVIWSAIK